MTLTLSLGSWVTCSAHRLTERNTCVKFNENHSKDSVYVTCHDILCPNAVKRDVGKTRCKSDVIMQLHFVAQFVRRLASFVNDV